MNEDNSDNKIHYHVLGFSNISLDNTYSFFTAR